MSAGSEATASRAIKKIAELLSLYVITMHDKAYSIAPATRKVLLRPVIFFATNTLKQTYVCRGPKSGIDDYGVTYE